MPAYKAPLGPLRELDLPIWARRQIESLQAENAELKKELERFEWKMAGLGDQYYCPICRSNREDGHRGSCSFGKALSGDMT